MVCRNRFQFGPVMMTDLASISEISVKTGVVLIGVQNRLRSSNHHWCYVDCMRTMLIRPFPGSKIEISDLGFLVKERLIQDFGLTRH